MPTSTFFNLPEEKRRRLIAAGFEEFSEFTIDKASISSIIRAAKIPRGSFYQYFDGKEDLHSYILNLYSKRWGERWVELLKQHHGDIFSTLPEFFAIFLDEMTDSKKARFWHNTMMSFQNEKTQKRIRKHSAKRTNEYFNAQMIDSSLLRIKLTPENENLLLHHIISMLMQSTHYYFYIKQTTNKDPRQEAINHFNKLLDWIEYGIRE